MRRLLLSLAVNVSSKRLIGSVLVPRFNSEQLDKYAIVHMEELHEDLFIADWVRNEVAELRAKDSTTKARARA